MEKSRRGLAIQYAMCFVGTPYCWGGDDPMGGFDCSGFVVEVLKAVGTLPYDGDWMASELYAKFICHKERPAPGYLVFWGNSRDEISHVELCIDSLHSIGASGGGPKVRTIEDAIRGNAFIRIRPIDRPDRRWRYYADPFAGV